MNEWNTNSLLTHINDKIDALVRFMDSNDRRYQERFASIERTQTESLRVQENYNRVHNDLMRQMAEQRADQQRDQMPRAQIEQVMAGQNKEIAEIKETLDRLAGRDLGGDKTAASTRASMQMVLAVAALVISVVSAAVVVLKLLAPLAGVLVPSH